MFEVVVDCGLRWHDGFDAFRLTLLYNTSDVFGDMLRQREHAAMPDRSVGPEKC